MKLNSARITAYATVAIAALAVAFCSSIDQGGGKRRGRRARLKSRIQR